MTARAKSIQNTHSGAGILPCANRHSIPTVLSKRISTHHARAYLLLPTVQEIAHQSTSQYQTMNPSHASPTIPTSRSTQIPRRAATGSMSSLGAARPATCPCTSLQHRRGDVNAKRTWDSETAQLRSNPNPTQIKSNQIKLKTESPAHHRKQKPYLNTAIQSNPVQSSRRETDEMR